MLHRLATLTTLVLSSCLFFSCGQSGSEEEPAAAVPVGPPATVMTEIAAWQALGGKTDVADLSPKPAAPGARNAAELHKPLIEILQSMSMADKEMIGDPWESPVSSLRYVLESYEKELATIKEAIAIPYCNWGTDFTEGQEALMPHLAYGRNSARLLICEARVKADAGDHNGAAESILNVLRLADQVATEPVAIAMLVRGSLDAMAVEGIRRFFKDQERIPSALLDALTKRDHRAWLRKALHCEGVMAIATFVELAGGQAALPIAQQPMSEPVAQGLIWNLQTIRRFVEQADRPLYQKTDEAEAQPLPAGARVPELYLDAEMIGRLSRTAASFENTVNLAIVALQLREHKAKHGEYPDPRTFKTPEDVYTGKPIEYVQGSKGFTLTAMHARFSGDGDVAEWKW